MASDQIKQELEALRAQLDELRREREHQPMPEAHAEADAGIDASGEVGDEIPKEAVEQAIGPDLMDQFKGLLDNLDEELKEVNPTTLLAVFALGIVIGRLLPR